MPGTGPRRAAPRRLRRPDRRRRARAAATPAAAIGADYSAVPSEAALFRRAGAHRPAAGLRPSPLPFSGRPVVVMMAPVFRADRPARTPAERRRALRGFVAGMYSTTELMRAAARACPRAPRCG